MKPEEFKDILKRYQEGQCTKEEEQLILEWYAAIDSEERNALLRNKEFKTAIEHRLWHKIKGKIEVEAEENSSPGRPAEKAMPLWRTYKIAASVSLLLMAVAALFFYHQRKSDGIPWQSEVNSSSEAMLTLVNSYSEPLSALFNDGSEVILYPGSQITYPEHFDSSKREIYLTGEAFFDVSKDAERPFLVYSQEIITKVLGTSFTVKAYSDEKEITVAVKTGKVSVSTHKRNFRGRTALPSQEIILNPNQQAVYNKEEDRVQKQVLENPKTALAKPVSFNMQYEEAPVVRIFEVLSEMYNVKVLYDERELAGCSLTTSMSDESLEERIKIICTAIGAEYVYSEDAITIKGDGCI